MATLDVTIRQMVPILMSLPRDIGASQVLDDEQTMVWMSCEDVSASKAAEVRTKNVAEHLSVVCGAGADGCVACASWGAADLLQNLCLHMNTTSR